MNNYATPSALQGMAASLSILSISSVGTRFYIRKVYKQGLGFDDWLLLPALLCTIGIGITVIISVQAQGLGYPQGDIDPNELSDQLIEVQKVEFAILLMSILGLGFAKLSILYFYRRIFVTGARSFFNTASNALAAFIGIWTIALFFSYIFQCTANISIQWGDYEDQGTYCINPEVYNLFLLASDLFLDTVILVLPLPMIASLKLSLARRVATMLVFSVGALALVASTIRLVITVIIYEGVGNAFVSTDTILIVSQYMYWTMLESGLGVIVACLPTLQIWFRKVTVETISRNVRGFFSVQSLSKASQVSFHNNNIAPPPEKFISATSLKRLEDYELQV